MTRRSRGTHVPAKGDGLSVERALSHLDRILGFEHASMRRARVTASIAMAAGRRWQVPLHLSPPRYALLPEPFDDREIRGDRFQSVSGDTSDGGQIGNRSRTTKAANARRDTMATVDAGSRLHRKILELSAAADALSRLERSIESGSAARTISAASRQATLLVATNPESLPRSYAGVSSRSRERLEATRTAFVGTGFNESARAASPIRGVMPPSNVLQREFVEPSDNLRGPRSGSGTLAGITINSSPTVVINAPAGGSDLQREVIGALRTHRAELFDQLKRESARRERAQF